MNQDIFLWSPVIISGLKSPMTCQQEQRYRNDQMFEHIDDIKVKVRNLQAERQGKMVEVRISLETIVIVEDAQGHTQLISRQEIIKDRLEFNKFDRPLEPDEKIGYIIQIQDLKWDGELHDDEMRISYSLKYMIFAAIEQAVKVYVDKEQESYSQEKANESQTIEMEIEKIRNDNARLYQKLYLYERDIISLQRSIKKVEGRNAALSKELNITQELIQKLRDSITRKDLLICGYENNQNNIREKILPIPLGLGEEKIGERIKRMFMNSL